MTWEDDDDYSSDDDSKYISREDARPESFSGGVLSSGNVQSFSCPNCGSYNTAQGTYFDECWTCGWSQAY